MTELCKEWIGFQSSLILDRLGKNSDLLLKLKSKQLMSFIFRSRISGGPSKKEGLENSSR